MVGEGRSGFWGGGGGTGAAGGVRFWEWFALFETACGSCAALGQGLGLMNVFFLVGVTDTRRPSPFPLVWGFFGNGVPYLGVFLFAPFYPRWIRYTAGRYTSRMKIDSFDPGRLTLFLIKQYTNPELTPLNVPKHVVLDRPLHRRRLAVLVLDARGAAVAG